MTGDFVMMILLSLATFVVVGILSHAELGRDFDAGWVTASASMTVMVLTFYATTWLWRISASLCRLIDLLTGRDGEVRPELSGTLQRFWRIAWELGR